jgi:hypothetical protein
VLNFAHVPQLQCLETFFPENIQECARRIFLLREEFHESFKGYTNMEQVVVLFILPGRYIEKAPENMQMGLIN